MDAVSEDRSSSHSSKPFDPSGSMSQISPVSSPIANAIFSRATERPIKPTFVMFDNANRVVWAWKTSFSFPLGCFVPPQLEMENSVPPLS